MTIQMIEEEIERLTRAERRITNDILKLINEAEAERIPQLRGFSNTITWLVRVYHYSESAAYRRVQAARALREIPDLEEKIEEGTLNLSAIAKVQSIVAQEERRTGHFIDRKEVLRKVESQSAVELERTLAAEFPEVAGRDESLRAINGNESRLTLLIDNEFRDLLEQAQNQLAHSVPDASMKEVLKRALKKLVKHSNTDAKKRRVIDRAGGRCEWVDPESGRRCDSRRLLQVDHIIPRAKGGSDDFANLRCLCRSHNLYEAERVFGKEKLAKHRVVRD